MQIDRILGNVGVLYVGAYNSSTQYEYLNCVTYNGSSYVCVNQNGVTGVTPGTTNDWQLSAQKGDTGAQGIQGEQGIQGATGNGIQSIEKTSSNALTDTYTILFTDGSSTTFEVENGKGIVSIEKTSSEGNIDTYTITYNDDTTSTFTVTNGEVTNEELQQALAQERVISDGKYARALKTPVTDVESTQIYAENDVVNDLVVNGVELTQKTREGYNEIQNEVETSSMGGIDITRNSDGSVTLNGTATENITLYYSTKSITLNGKYIFYLIGKNNNINLQGIEDGSTTVYLTYASSSNYIERSYEADTVLSSFFSYITIGKTFNNETFYPMITKGEEVKPYEQYGASPSLDFPSEVQVASEQNITINETNITIPLTNSSIGQYADTIDRENNVQNKVIQELTLTGNENWIASGSNDVTNSFQLNLNTIVKDYTGLCNYLKTGVAGNVEKFTPLGTSLYVAVNKTRASTVEEFKALLAQLNSSGNPLKFYLARVSPTTNQLSEEVQTALSNFKLYQDLNNVAIDGGSMSFIYNKSLIYTINQLTQLVQTLSSEVQALQTPTTEPTVETTSEVQADG